MNSKTIFVQNVTTGIYTASAYLDTDDDNDQYKISLIDMYTSDSYDTEYLKFTKQQLKDLNQKISELLISEENRYEKNDAE